tara:strand:+ start:3991 stop:4158 length:168 start_codon:yes stop_codon:yes gene_type:complete
VADDLSIDRDKRDIEIEYSDAPVKQPGKMDLQFAGSDEQPPLQKTRNDLVEDSIT